MRDRRRRRARRRHAAVDVDPLRVLRRRGERVDPLLGDLDPATSARARRPTRSRALRPCDAAAARDASSDVSRPRSSRLSYSPGDTRDPVTATRIGRYTVRGFSPSSSQSRFSATSISAAVHGSTAASAAPAASRIARVEQRRVRLDVVEQEAREARELVEPADLLLDERRRRFARAPPASRCPCSREVTR